MKRLLSLQTIGFSGMTRVASIAYVTLVLLAFYSARASSHQFDQRSVHERPFLNSSRKLALDDTDVISSTSPSGGAEKLSGDVAPHIGHVDDAVEIAEHGVKAEDFLGIFNLTMPLEDPSFLPVLTHREFTASHSKEDHSDDHWLSLLEQEESKQLNSSAPEGMGDIAGDTVRRVLTSKNGGIPHLSGSVFNHPTARLTFPNFRYAPQFILQGHASLHNGAIHLTSPSRRYSFGAAVLRTPVQLLGFPKKPRRACANVPFATSFVYSVSGPTAGLTFFAALNSRNLGAAGSYLGWGGPNVRYHRPSFAIEFDNVKDPKFDPYPNHVGLDVNYVMKSTKISRELFTKARVRLGDRGVKKVWISYNEGILKVFVAQGPKAHLPKQPVLATPIDLCSFFPQPQVYLGFSASTGRAKGGSLELRRWTYVTPGTSTCTSCVSTSLPSTAVKCCPPFQCCFGYCLSPTELCGGDKCCGAPDSGRVCWGEQCCSSFSACLTPKGKQVCCPTLGDTTCCL